MFRPHPVPTVGPRESNPVRREVLDVMFWLADALYFDVSDRSFSPFRSLLLYGPLAAHLALTMCPVLLYIGLFVC